MALSVVMLPPWQIISALLTIFFLLHFSQFGAAAVRHVYGDWACVLFASEARTKNSEQTSPQQAKNDPLLVCFCANQISKNLLTNQPYES